MPWDRALYFDFNHEEDNKTSGLFVSYARPGPECRMTKSLKKGCTGETAAAQT